MEEKIVKEKKETTKAKTTRTKTSSNKKKEQEVANAMPQDLKLEDIPQELVMQLFETFKNMQSKEKAVSVPKEEDDRPQKITKAYLRKIKDKEVVVRSAVGLVVFKSPKTGIIYRWTDVGDEEVLTVDEVLQMEATSKRFLSTPWLMLDDEEVIEGLGLSELYSNIKKVEDVDSLLELEIYEIEALINKLPHDFKQELSNKIFVKVSNDEIRDTVLIRTLEGLLKTNFTI